jgi:hypothetical protein
MTTARRAPPQNTPDSAAVKRAGGNPWKEVGTWTAEPFAAETLTALRDYRVLLGLRNGDDQGANFDLRASSQEWHRGRVVGRTLY